MMKKIFRWTLVALVTLAAIYFLGPKVDCEPLVTPTIEPLSLSLDSLDRYVKQKDLDVPNLKPGNASRIVWNGDSLYRTPYSLVYLHGFSASPMEGYPAHEQVAKALGMNLYLPLLAGHGRADRESLVNLQPNDLIRDAKEAIAIGKLLGERVVVMGCSTGGTLAIYLDSANPDLIDLLVLYSPNIALKDPTAPLVTGPWGKQIVQAVVGDYWNPDGTVDSPEAAQYWTTTYHSNGIIALQSLLDQTMISEVFSALRTPYFMGFYYQDEAHQDPTVSVAAMHDFHTQTATPRDQTMVVPFATVGHHVIANEWKSNDHEAVVQATLDFLKQVGVSSFGGQTNQLNHE